MQHQKLLEKSILDKSAGISSIEKLLLRNIARFELIQHFFKNDINLLEELLSKWQEQLLKMNASRKLVHLGVLDEISFAHVSEVLKILKKILNSTSEPETISSIFGQRTITHDDVILALPWIIYRIAPYVQTDGEQKEILALLCDLVIKEHDIATRRPHGLPNDGKRAKSVLPRVITGSPNFLSSFEKPAFEKATELFNDIYYRGNISETQKIHLDTLVKPLLSVQQENTLFDGKTFTIRFFHIFYGKLVVKCQVNRQRNRKFLKLLKPNPSLLINLSLLLIPSTGPLVVLLSK